MLIFRVRTHTKNKDQMDDMKKFVLYQLERLERYYLEIRRRKA